MGTCRPRRVHVSVPQAATDNSSRQTRSVNLPGWRADLASGGIRTPSVGGIPQTHFMATRLNPYLSFRDQARDAITFYQTVFGGELELTTFAEGGMPHDPSDAEKVMHSQLTSPGELVLMASDAPSGMDLDSGSTVSISLSGDDEAELRGYWDALSEGATITMPLAAAPWGDSFGMLTDRFGTAWMVNIAGAPDQ